MEGYVVRWAISAGTRAELRKTCLSLWAHVLPMGGMYLDAVCCPEYDKCRGNMNSTPPCGETPFMLSKLLIIAVGI